MQVLVHLGLNKCASTFVQRRLQASRDGLRAVGCSYPGAGPAGAQYGLSKHYGFGPDAPEVAATYARQLLDLAADEGADRVILSSEYLSLQRPQAAARLVRDLDAAGAEVRYVLFSRPVLGWVAALFNQYVKTVDAARPMPHIDAFVDQIFRNRTIDIAARYRVWADLVGEDAIAHYHLSGASDRNDVLRPFEAFAGCPIEALPCQGENRSLSPDQLYSVGALRAQPPSLLRTRAISRLLAGGAPTLRAPESYLRLSEDRKARLRTEIEAPYLALPHHAFPGARDTAKAGTPAQGAVAARTPTHAAPRSLEGHPWFGLWPETAGSRETWPGQQPAERSSAAMRPAIRGNAEAPARPDPVVLVGGVASQPAAASALDSAARLGDLDRTTAAQDHELSRSGQLRLARDRGAGGFEQARRKLLGFAAQFYRKPRRTVHAAQTGA